MHRHYRLSARILNIKGNFEKSEQLWGGGVGSRVLLDWLFRIIRWASRPILRSTYAFRLTLILDARRDVDAIA
jgi:hypothetical protein